MCVVAARAWDVCLLLFRGAVPCPRCRFFCRSTTVSSTKTRFETPHSPVGCRRILIRATINSKHTLTAAGSAQFAYHRIVRTTKRRSFLLSIAACTRTQARTRTHAEDGDDANAKCVRLLSVLTSHATWRKCYHTVRTFEQKRQILPALGQV